jgi:chemotaxis response regulator CheB
VQKLRVLVANRPRLMRELVLATIFDQPDIEIAGEIKEDSEIRNVVAECCPDFLIIALDSPGKRPIICDELLRQHPQMKILALAPESNSSVFFWCVVDIHSARVESSEDGILNALRGKAQLIEQRQVI